MRHLINAVADLKILWELLRDAGQRWIKDRAPQLAAAVAFYTAFSLAPLLLIAIGFAGLFADEELVQRQVTAQISSLVGPTSAQFIAGVMESAAASRSSVAATLIGIVVLLVASTGVFHQLQVALNLIWGVEPKPNMNMFSLLRARLLSFAMILIIGFLLLVSLIISALLSALHEYMRVLIPAEPFLWQTVNFGVSYLFTTVLFAMLYKLLPDVRIKWRDVTVGAAVTALLFTLGKFIIGLYLGNSGISSIYGAAGSFAVLLLWVYFSAQILLYGAEITQIYANRFGWGIVPSNIAVAVTDVTRQAIESREERTQRRKRRKTDDTAE